MTTGITPSDYQMYVQEFLDKNRTQMGGNYSSANLQNIQDQSIFYKSEKGNTCTDGIDDGKIGLGAKIKGVGKGILDGAKGMVTNIIKHPFKTAAMVGACCIPVVGPAIGVGLASYGLYSGAKTIANGVMVANSATSDAEAKDAWENIGTGALTVAGSAVALKGSAGVLKNQLKNSNTAATFKTAKAEGKTMAETLRDTSEVAVRETADNLKAVGGQIKEKTYDKAKGVYDKAKEYSGGEKLTADGIKKTANEMGKEFVDKTAEKASRAGEKIGKKIDEYNTTKTKDKISTKENLAQAKAEAEAKGLTFEKTGSGYKTTDGTTTSYYNKKGKLLKEEYTMKNGETEVKGSIDKKTSVEKYTMKDETTATTGKKHNGWEIKKIKTKNAEGKTTTTKEYSYNGKTIENPSSLDKLKAEYNTTNAGVKADEFISNPFTIKGHKIPLTDEQLMGIGLLLNLES